MSILMICSVFCTVPAILVLLFGQFNTSRPEIADIGFLVISFLLIDLVCLILAKAGVNNMPFFHLTTAIELVIFSKIYFQNSSGVIKSGIKAVAITGLILMFFNIMFNESLLEFNSVARSVQAAILLSFAVAWFIEVFQKMESEKLTSDPILYISSGVLIYYGSSAVIFGMYNSLILNHSDLVNRLWEGHSILNIVLNLLLAVALFKLQEPEGELVK